MTALFGGSWGPNGLRISQVCSLVCLGQVPGWLSLAAGRTPGQAELSGASDSSMLTSGGWPWGAESQPLPAAQLPFS